MDHINEMKWTFNQNYFLELCRKSFLHSLSPNKVAVVSGGFDPYGPHHSSLISEASKYGDVIVILNSDEWLVRKKGYVFMPFEDRKRIMMSLKGVVDVIKAKDDDNTVCKNLLDVKPDFFCNGGDRGKDSTPEAKICNKLGIDLLWGVGGEHKENSSSEIINRVVEKLSK
jgi:glycerol-3-phosphate cytidylyltransferase-like family protein